MRILVTSDDGIKSEGLKHLVEFAKELGEVLIVAPKVEQSAKSQAINVRTGFSVEKIDYNGIEAYCVDSTPADCVRFAIYYLKYDFDLLMSGINRGYNSGEDILYSGTVAAATEGALVGKNSLAISTSHKTFEGKKYLKEAIDYIIENKLLEKHNFWNINLPIDSKGIQVTKQGCTNFDTYFEKRGDLFYQMGDPHFDLEKDFDSDTKAIWDGYISISPLTIDRTKYFNN